MRVSKSFMSEFAFLANLYGWEGKVLEEVKAQTRGNADLMQYWLELASAHRRGYRQTRENNYQRLGEWEQTR